jgi:hypothetical protein
MPEDHSQHTGAFDDVAMASHPKGPNLPEREWRTAAGNRLPILAVVVLVAVLMAGVILFGVFMFRSPATAATLRDIFLVVLGVQSMIIGLLLIAVLVSLVYLVLKLYDLVHLVQTELRPIMQQADDTVRTVRSRAVFISDSAVKPVIEVMACVAAVKSIIRSFTRSER